MAGLEETLPPLFEFISRLAKSGERAAKDLYGCRKGNVCENYLKMLLYVGCVDNVDFVQYGSIHIVHGSIEARKHWLMVLSISTNSNLKIDIKMIISIPNGLSAICP